MSLFVKSEYIILKLIYENPGIMLSELMKRARVSAGTLKERIESLLDREIVAERKIIRGKKVLIKSFYPNLESERGKHIFSLIELEKKYEFFKRNKKLIGPFKQLMNNLENIKIIIVFGSFASYSETKDSDLDILLLGEKLPKKDLLKKEIERSFITFDYDVSPRIDALDNFRKYRGEAFYQSIFKNHVIIKGAADFLELAKLE